MDELTFLLILSGIGVVLLVAMFTYYKHHKKIHDEIQDFNHHSHDMDDVLLKDFNTREQESGFSMPEKNQSLYSNQSLNDTDMPDSFSASKQDDIDFDEINFSRNLKTKDKTRDKGELIDGVYINTKRVISNTPANSSANESKSHDASQSLDAAVIDSYTTPEQQNEVPHHSQNDKVQTYSPVHANEDAQREVSTFTRTETAREPKAVPEQKPGRSIKVVYDPLPEGVKELIISHNILAKDDYFTGQRLFDVIQSAGLEFGEMNIFHYPGEDKAETFALFSIANAVEPGIFHLEEAEDFSTPGISMFMRLPTRMSGLDAYDKFVTTAQYIASELNGELCDESRNLLTQQTISYKKEQIRELNFNMAKAAKLAGTN